MSRAITILVFCTLLLLADRTVAGFAQCRALGCLPGEAAVQP